MRELFFKMQTAAMRLCSAALLLLFFPMNTQAQFGPNDTPKKGNSWQYRLPTGDIVRVQHNNDGSTGWTMNTNCSLCFGTGTCQSCYGRGGMQIGSSRYGYWNTCGMCGGLGRCHGCNGKGKVEHYYHFDQYGNCTTINPYTLQMQTFDANACGITPQVRERESNDYVSSGSSTNRMQCPVCHGNPSFTQERPIYVNDMYCDVCCRRTYGHVHVKCQSCYGRGWIRY